MIVVSDWHATCEALHFTAVSAIYSTMKIYNEMHLVKFKRAKQ